MELESENQEINSIECLTPQTSLRSAQLEALMQDDEVINAELNEEEMNRNDKEFSKEEEKEKEIWDPVKGQEFLQAELAKECEDVEIEDEKERERIQKIQEITYHDSNRKRG